MKQRLSDCEEWRRIGQKMLADLSTAQGAKVAVDTGFPIRRRQIVVECWGDISIQVMLKNTDETVPVFAGVIGQYGQTFFKPNIDFLMLFPPKNRAAALRKVAREIAKDGDKAAADFGKGWRLCIYPKMKEIFKATEAETEGDGEDNEGENNDRTV